MKRWSPTVVVAYSLFSMCGCLHLQQQEMPCTCCCTNGVPGSTDLQESLGRVHDEPNPKPVVLRCKPHWERVEVAPQGNVQRMTWMLMIPLSPGDSGVSVDAPPFLKAVLSETNHYWFTALPDHVRSSSGSVWNMGELLSVSDRKGVIWARPLKDRGRMSFREPSKDVAPNKPSEATSQ